MKLDFNNFPLDIFKTEECKKYFDGILFQKTSLNIIDEIIPNAIGKLIVDKHFTIIESFNFKIEDSFIKLFLKEMIKGEINNYRQGKNNILSISQFNAIIIYIITRERLFNHRVNSMNESVIKMGKVIYKFIRTRNLFQSYEESHSEIEDKLLLQCNEICRVYTLSLLMQILFCGRKLSAQEENLIENLIKELLTKQKNSTSMHINNNDLYTTSLLPILLQDKKEQSIKRYIETNLDTLKNDTQTYLDSLSLNFNNTSIIKNWINDYITYEKKWH